MQKCIGVFFKINSKKTFQFDSDVVLYIIEKYVSRRGMEK